MKRPNSGTLIIAVCTGGLLFLSTAIPAYAERQQNEKDENRPKHEQQARGQEERQRHEQARGQEERQRHEQQARGQEEQQRHEQQARGQEERQRHEQQPRGQQEQQRHEQEARGQQERHEQADMRVVWQEHRSKNWRNEHRTWRQRGGYHGYRIPRDRFHGNFGRNHRFRINSLSFDIFGGSPRFQYDGFWFSVVDPWPEYWSDNWYENDDVYIDYSGDGYYLYNRRHPHDRIAITVFLN